MKIKFVAPLANVEDSVCGINLLPEVDINKYNVEKTINELHDRQYITPNDLGYLWDSAFLDMDTDDIFLLEGELEFHSPTFDGPKDTVVEDIISVPANTGISIYSDEELIDMKIDEFSKAVREKIRLLDLFSKGSIDAPKYIFRFSGARWYNFSRSIGNYQRISRNVKRFSPKNIENINSFLHEIDLETREDYLKIAFKYFDDHYKQENPRMRYLQLMMTTEAIFSRAQSELTYTLSRGMAVLLGNTISESEDIFEEMKKYYNLRSRIIHGDKVTDPDDGTIDRLRQHLKICLRYLLYRNISRKQLMGEITRSGYGEHNYIKRDGFPFYLE